MMGKIRGHPKNEPVKTAWYQESGFPATQDLHLPLKVSLPWLTT